MSGIQVPNRFSIFHHGLAKGPAYEAWREGICRGFCRLDVGPTDDNRIDCHNEFTLLHTVAIATPCGGSARFARTRALLNDGCDDLVLIFATRGTVQVTQAGKAIELQRGQMCLTEMNIVGTADLTRSGSFTTTRFPRRLLLQIAPSAETQLARPLGRDPALSAMIERYSALCTELAGDLDLPGQQAAAHHLADLVGLVLGSSAERKELAARDGVAKARLDLMKADVLKNLDNGKLTIEAVAKANALSTRQAQRLFASAGTTFSEFVLEQRLLLARRLLLHEEGAGRKVSDIAYTAGFNDLSYFHRSFRRKFGVAPAEMQMELGRRH
ncbi:MULTISPECIES: AraC family transcriptional regulator [Bradyrhizobium]|uniref:AraC family transcriptional regulator n=1 Tax=Bradyrhizobium TaxID=374 RepID=UPI00048622D9|nr:MULTISPECIES: AraC family transcriptional regulator [Bradyrhizobium]MCS3446170.1 AraC-like DNA-binding protein [Bradyrhizobium elkanii]MCS3562697.1 AraC-like DNA-binding protein [Bradyrhizobium elkanii]MCW2147466.1 AraC-like DNA-binding protein [Bradyrhizobium elkanii]MCW2353450.1 AraC-like DNA-binding protein [Bradyrhizobium elkanii]MCW2371193.1 AraC-like DNA-binding protein [Bradyrhizobium elkanii]